MNCNFENQYSGTNNVSKRVNIMLDLYQCHIVESDYEFLWEIMPANITDEELFEFCRLVPDFLKDYH